MAERGTPTDRKILELALPALGALVAEPLFLLADSAIVGRLGTAPLAGLGLAGAILATAVNVFIFLAYGTTSSVARRIGAGDRDGAIAGGIDAAWLAAGLGVGVAVLGWPAAPLLVRLLGGDGAVRTAAVTYLRWSLPGVPAMLVVLALVGVLRGLQNTRITLWIAGIGAVVNALLNLCLVHGLGWGIKGSAIGTALTQLGMAGVAGGIVLSAARRSGVPWRIRWDGVRLAGRAGVPLLVRTVAMRAVLLLTTGVAATLGAPALAAHQVAANVWTLLAMGLDALAIAGQVLTGAALGAGDVTGVRSATARMVRWGTGVGVVFGVVLLLCGSLLAPLFSPDPAVRRALTGGTGGGRGDAAAGRLRVRPGRRADRRRRRALPRGRRGGPDRRFHTAGAGRRPVGARRHHGSGAALAGLRRRLDGPARGPAAMARPR